MIIGHLAICWNFSCYKFQQMARCPSRKLEQITLMKVSHVKLSRFSFKLLKCYLSRSYNSRTTRFFSSQHAEERSGPLKILFYGTDSFSEVALKALNVNRISGQHQVVKEIDVVCVPVDCPVRRYAESVSLHIHFWPYAVPAGQYDVGVVVSFGHLIPSKSISACTYGMLNAHPSLLPRWRGAAPIYHTVLTGDTETGVTIIQVAPKRFDVGNIIMQQKYSIPSRSTYEQLHSALAQMAADLIIKSLGNLPQYLKNSWPQPKDGVTLAPKISSSVACMKWEEYSWVDIEARFRALKGLFKVYTFWKNMKIYVLEMLDHEEVVAAKIPTLVPGDVPPGYCYYHKKRKYLYVKCKDDWVGIKSFGSPGGKLITARDFYNGFLSKVTSDEHIFQSTSDDRCNSDDSKD